MASSSSHEVLSNAHENTDTYSVYNCVFCNVLLNGKAKLLDCFHVTCYECMNEKKCKETDGLLCKCRVVTYGFLANYSIVSPDVSITKTCHNCDSVVKKVCVSCNQYYCIPCSETHINSTRRDHHPDVVISYPTDADFVMCQECTQEKAKIYCLRCGVMTCIPCHIISHRPHGFKPIGEYCNHVTKSLADKLHKLNKNDERIKKAIDDISKETQKLEIQKNAVLSEIDIAAQKLHDQINKRVLELKEEAENRYSDSVGLINKNQRELLNYFNDHTYNKKFLNTVLVHDEVYDFLHIASAVFKKLDDTLIPMPEISKLKTDMKFVSNSSSIKCVSTINRFGSVILLPHNNLLPNKSEDIINDTDGIINEAIESDSNDFDENMSIDSNNSACDPLGECSCCHQCDGILIQCKSCARRFHLECHIPTPQNVNVSRSTWKCTLCRDITKFAKVLNQRDLRSEIPVGDIERTIMNRILMELYCENYDTEFCRELPNEEIDPDFYQLVPDPISLNDIKNTLESDDPYTSLIQFLLDLKKIFMNGLMYYSSHHPYYRSALNFKFYFKKCINTWIPKLINDNRLH